MLPQSIIEDFLMFIFYATIFSTMVYLSNIYPVSLEKQFCMQQNKNSRFFVYILSCAGQYLLLFPFYI